MSDEDNDKMLSEYEQNQLETAQFRAFMKRWMVTGPAVAAAAVTLGLTWLYSKTDERYIKRSEEAVTHAVVEKRLDELATTIVANHKNVYTLADATNALAIADAKTDGRIDTLNSKIDNLGRLTEEVLRELRKSGE